jgi:hypothetical protein
MSSQFPDFPALNPLDARRSWTATFDSYDQRNDDAYYVVTIHEAGAVTATFMVQVGMYWAGDDWSGPEFLPRLKEEIQRIAATGKANTSYTGALVPRTH